MARRKGPRPQGQARTDEGPAGFDEFVKWACSEILRLLDAERTKRANVRRDAHATTAFVLIPVGFYLTLFGKAPGHSAHETTLLVLLLISMSLVLVFWCLAMQVREVGSLDIEELSHEPLTTGRERYARAHGHLLLCLADSQKVTQSLSKMRLWNLRSAATSLIVVIVLISLKLYNGI